MAARYWVGGTGTWSSGNTANWSTTSGGAGGASVPGSSDTAFFDANSGSGVVTFTNSGVTVGGTNINNINIELSLGAAFTSNSTFTTTTGVLTTNNYNLTANAFASTSNSARTINFGSSTVTVNASFGLFVGNLTFNAGTSLIVLTGGSPSFDGASQTFYNVSFTSTSLAATVSASITGNNTFNNVTIAARASAGVGFFRFSSAAVQTINGVLTLSPPSTPGARMVFASDVAGNAADLVVNSFASGALDCDFQNIAITGAAAPISGTRFGDRLGNSGIVFDSPKTVYWNLAAGGNWTSTAWALTSGGAVSQNNFPLAQDSVVFESTGLNSGSSVTSSAAYALTNIDTSARTSNTMTLTCNFYILGNFVNGTGCTFAGTSAVVFGGDTDQSLLSAGSAFTSPITLEKLGGALVLQDAFTTTRAIANAILLTRGALNLNGYAATASAGGLTISSSTAYPRTITMGLGSITLGGASFTVNSATNVTISGPGVISMTSAASKTFTGGGYQSFPTLNQGGAGTLTISGSNKFADITNTAIGTIQFTGGTTNEFDSFSINGTAGNLLTLTSTTTTQAILKKPTAWNVGVNSTNSGNNTGLSFTAGGNDYLNISYINGQTTALPSTGNFMMMFL